MDYLNGWYRPLSKLLGFEMSPTPDQSNLWPSGEVTKLTWSSLENVSHELLEAVDICDAWLVQNG